MGTEGVRPKQNRPGGLSGKARHNRSRNRAWRLQSQQLIEEFVDPDKKKKRRPRHIPIKHRAEFLPSAPVMGSKYGVGTEQELELVYSTESGDSDLDGGLFDKAYAIVSPDSADESAITFSTPKIAKRRGQHDSSIGPAERDALFANRWRKTVFGKGGPTAIETFTARGFALGCALGTATAAALLVMVRAAFL